MNLPEIPQPYLWILEGLLLVIMIWFVQKNRFQLKKASEDIGWPRWIMILVPLILISSVLIGIFWNQDPDAKQYVIDVRQNILSWVLTVLLCLIAIRFLFLRFRRKPDSAAT